MTYLPQLTARADRDLRAIPDKYASACVEFIVRPLVEDPRRVGKPLRDQLAGKYVARRGPYRVVYTIDDAEKSVVIEHIQHRRHVYR